MYGTDPPADPDRKPRAFTDTKGRRWSLAMAYRDVARVKTLTGIDIGKSISGDFAEVGRVLSDMTTLVDVVWALVLPQAEKLGVTEEDFASALTGQEVEDAGMAFVRAFSDFSPSHLRPMIAAVAEKVEAEMDTRNRLMRAELARMAAELARMVAANEAARAAANATPSTSATPSPES